jgi:hypothetical protein
MANNPGYILWLQIVQRIPTWELTVGIIFLSILILSAIIYEIMRIYQVRIFHSFEKIKLKQKDLERSFKDTEYIEITIPKNSGAYNKLCLV